MLPERRACRQPVVVAAQMWAWRALDVDIEIPEQAMAELDIGQGERVTREIG